MEDTDDKDLYLRYLISKKQRLQEKKNKLEEESIKLTLQVEKIKEKYQ